MRINFKKFIPFVVFALVFFVHLLYFNIFVMKSNPKWWTFYLRMEQYLVGFSLGLAFALMVMRGRSKSAVAGSAVIAFLVWFTSCCGAPMLVILFGVLGITVGSVHLSPTFMAGVTLIFVSLGMIWLMHKTKKGGEKMAEEGKIYFCEMCKAEVQVIKKTVPDPKCPTLTCCGKDMKEKD